MKIMELGADGLYLGSTTDHQVYLTDDYHKRLWMLDSGVEELDLDYAQKYSL